MKTEPSELPPEYVNLPTSMAYAYEVDDELLVTMVRILGLCWEYNYERTPALKPDELVELTGRTRSTLYRHIKQLCDMAWIRVDKAGRHTIIRPIVPCRERAQRETEVAETKQDASRQAANEALVQALADVGIEWPKRDRLARMDIDPLWVYAWYLWTRHPHRQSLTSPIGNIILKLEHGERPPEQFLREARQYLDYKDILEHPPALRPAKNQPEIEDPDVPQEAQSLWAAALGELALQMTRATFDTWLRGSRVVGAGDDVLTILVRHAYAVDWLQNRLLPLIRRTVERRAGRAIEIEFVARQTDTSLDDEGCEEEQGEPGD